MRKNIEDLQPLIRQQLLQVLVMVVDQVQRSLTHNIAANTDSMISNLDPDLSVQLESEISKLEQLIRKQLTEHNGLSLCAKLINKQISSPKFNSRWSDRMAHVINTDSNQQ